MIFMRFIKVNISQIDYTYTSYTKQLKDSILRIGFSFPIHVIVQNNQYVCIDGHKRLSALHDILQENPFYHRGSEICVLVKNNMNNRSNDCWKGRNTH